MAYKIIAILILAAFYGIYYIKLISQRKQGIQTNLLGKGKKGFVKTIEDSLKIVTFVAPIVELISIFMDTYIDLTWVRVLGCILGILGVVVFAVSVLTMRDSWRTGVPNDKKTELVTSGVYFDLIYLSILFMFFNRGLLVITVLTVVMFHLQIVKVEEDFLIKTFGEEYLEYRKKVCRYIGRKR